SVSTIRRPFGTYFARPSGHESFSIEAGLMKVPLYLKGIVADSICCHTLCLNSLASVEDAVNTILGEPTWIASVSITLSCRPPVSAQSADRSRSDFCRSPYRVSRD